MRVVIEGWDFVDLWEQALVNLLDIWTGKRAGLGWEECWKGRDAEQKPGKSRVDNLSFHPQGLKPYSLRAIMRANAALT